MAENEPPSPERADKVKAFLREHWVEILIAAGVIAVILVIRANAQEVAAANPEKPISWHIERWLSEFMPTSAVGLLLYLVRRTTVLAKRAQERFNEVCDRIETVHTFVQEHGEQNLEIWRRLDVWTKAHP